MSNARRSVLLPRGHNYAQSAVAAVRRSGRAHANLKFTDRLCGEALAAACKGARPNPMVFRLRCVASQPVKPADLAARALAQSPLIGRLACLGAEPHAPIALNDRAERSAAMVAAQSHELRVHALIAGGR